MRLTRIVLLVVLLAGIGSAVASWVGSSAPRIEVPALRIEVLNGCGEPGLAHGAAERLRALGHDVVRVEDAAGPDFLRSVLVDRRGRDRLTRALARQIGPCPVVLERIERSDVDLTLIVGADHRGLRLFSSGGSV